MSLRLPLHPADTSHLAMFHRAFDTKLCCSNAAVLVVHMAQIRPPRREKEQKEELDFCAQSLKYRPANQSNGTRTWLEIREGPRGNEFSRLAS
jgi:hypothetical protein